MGNPKRIPMGAIQAMKKILDALPDKHLDKTKEEALAMLNGQIQKAYAKGYSVKELAAIISKGKVAVSAPTLRAHTCPSSPRARKAKSQAESPKNEAGKTEKQANAVWRQSEEMVRHSPGSIIIKPDTPKEDL
jgi:hypothetical protein